MNGRTPQLSPFLAACVARGVIDEPAALAIERFREASGMGLAGSLREFGVPLPAEPVGGGGSTPDGAFAFAPLLLPVPPDPAMTFDSFVPAAANARAVQLGRHVLENPGVPENALLCVLGDPGVGKTHLLSAMAHAAGAPGALLVHLTDFDVEVERGRRLGARGELRAWLAGAELLLLDDVHLVEDEPALQRELLALLDRRARARLPTVCSSTRPWARLEPFEATLASRLEAAPVAELRIGDAPERAEILRRSTQGKSLPGPVIDYLATHVGDSVRRLKAAATQLLAMVQGTGLEVDLELARAVVPLERDLVRAARRPESTPPEKRVRRPSGRVSIMREAGREGGKAQRFKEMLAGAETPEEQGLALEIAIGERLRELRREGRDAKAVARLEQALELLRQGKLEEALRQMDG